MRMRIRVGFLNLFICFCVAFANAQERKLIWEDNFEGNQLDSSYWNFDLGDGCPKICGWGNNERQIYTKSNHQIKDGYLIITAKKEEERYTSTRITTKNKREFKYGRFEARIKLPQGQGVWPAFWLLGADISEVGWPKTGEIDILEYVGKEPGMVYNTLHTSDSFGNSKNSKKTKIENIENGFHVYALQWSAEKIDFFVDDRWLYTFEPTAKTGENWPFDKPFFIILNLAIGGNFGGPDVDDKIFPQEFIIDYVRVYE